MKILCCEYAVSGGGFEEESLAVPGNTFLREGAAMLRAVIADLKRVPGVVTRVLRDRRLAYIALPGDEVVEVGTAAEFHERLVDEARLADRVFLIAPECGGVLARLTCEVECAGGSLLTPAGELVRIASDKNETACHLAAAGVPTAVGFAMAAGAALPSDFDYPAVLKPADGAGSAEVSLVPAWRPGLVAPSCFPQWRLERCVAGHAASVMVLSLNGRTVCFPPCWQQLSDDGRFAYLGGATPIPARFAVRAEALARAAVAALPPANGLFGFDIVLATLDDDASVPGDQQPLGGVERPQASTRWRLGDVVIEVNPRLTTSYLGVRRLLVDNPMAALLSGRVPESWRLAPWASADEPIVFTAEDSHGVDLEAK